MDRDTWFISAIIIAGVLALLNAWRGAYLIRSGDMAGGRKAMVLGLAMLMLIGFAIYIRPV
jgi:hypothetical protein